MIFFLGLNAFLLHVIMVIVKWPSWFQKVLQVVHIVNWNTYLVLPSRFHPIFWWRLTSPHLKLWHMSCVPHKKDHSAYLKMCHYISSNTCGIHVTLDAKNNKKLLFFFFFFFFFFKGLKNWGWSGVARATLMAQPGSGRTNWQNGGGWNHFCLARGWVQPPQIDQPRGGWTTPMALGVVSPPPKGQRKKTEWRVGPLGLFWPPPFL
jgi:hypothetical protein